MFPDYGNLFQFFFFFDSLYPPTQTTNEKKLPNLNYLESFPGIVMLNFPYLQKKTQILSTIFIIHIFLFGFHHNYHRCCCLIFVIVRLEFLVIHFHFHFLGWLFGFFFSISNIIIIIITYSIVLFWHFSICFLFGCCCCLRLNNNLNQKTITRYFLVIWSFRKQKIGKIFRNLIFF